MGLFRYEAIDKSGKVVRGVMNAPDEHRVAVNLINMGYTARSISGGSSQQAGKANLSAVAAAPVVAAGQGKGIAAVTIASGVPVSIKSKVPASRLAAFFRQLATLVNSGVPLHESLLDVMRNAKNRHIKRALPHMQEALQSGQKLSSAMAMFPDVFPVHVIASIWSGELAGKLDIALDEVASDMEAEASDTRYGSIGWGLTKISLISFILLLPLSDMRKLLAPVLGGDGASVSVMIHQFMSLVLKAVPVAVAVIISWIIWGFIKRVPDVRRLLDGILLRSFVWGKIHRYRALSRFLHVLDGLHSAGLSPNAAWDAASLTPRNSEIAEKLRLARTSVSANAGVTDLFTASGVFENDDVGLAMAGEKSGRVPEMLAKLSSTYADRVNAVKMQGRLFSISAMITFSIILTGIIVIIMAWSYFESVFKAAGV